MKLIMALATTAVFAATMVHGVEAGRSGIKPVRADGGIATPTNGVGKVSPFYRKTGGMVRRPNVKQGRIAVFNAQRIVPAIDLESTIKRLVRHVHADMPIIERDKAGDVAGMMAASKEAEAEFAIFIVDEAANPCSLSVFPDQRLAVVNLAVLRLNGGEGAFLSARTRKELARAFLFLCGGASSQAPGNLMAGMKSISDLDKYPDEAIPVDVLGRTLRYLPEAGCNLRTMVPYRTACREGWAPAPTNDIQKAIWNEVRQLPTKPIKIEFDPAKGK